MARVTGALVKAPLMLIDVQVHRTACIYFQEKLCVFQRDGAKSHPSSFPGALLCSPDPSHIENIWYIRKPKVTKNVSNR